VASHQGQDEYSRQPASPTSSKRRYVFLTWRNHADACRPGDVRADHAGPAAQSCQALAARPARLKGAKKGILRVFVEPSLALATDTPPGAREWCTRSSTMATAFRRAIDGGQGQALTRKGLTGGALPPDRIGVEEVPVGSALLGRRDRRPGEKRISTFAGLQTV